MSKCPRCGSIIPDGNKFCINCGLNLAGANPSGVGIPEDTKTEILPMGGQPYPAANPYAGGAQQPGMSASRQPGIPASQQPNIPVSQQPGIPASQQPGIPVSQQPQAASGQQRQPYSLMGQDSYGAQGQNKSPYIQQPEAGNPQAAGKKAKAGKEKAGKASRIIIPSILGLACIGLTIALVFCYLTLTALKKDTDYQISELKAELDTAQNEVSDLQAKYEIKKNEYNNKVTSYNALNSSYIEMNENWELIHNTISSMRTYNDEITFESNIYSVRAGETIRIEGEWTGYSTAEVFMGTDYYNIISVEWENDGNTPYIKTKGLQPGVGIIKLGSDEYCTVNPFALVVIVYE